MAGRLVMDIATLVKNKEMSNGYLIVAFIATALFLYTRIFSRSRQKNGLPPWVPLEIGISTALLQSSGIASYLPFLLRRRYGSLFGLTSRHQILYNIQGVEKVFAKGFHTLDVDSLGLSLSIRVFGAKVPQKTCDEFSVLNRKLVAPLERGFVNEAAANASIHTADIPGKIASLFSFATESQNQHIWERSAGIKVLTPDVVGQAGAVEANLEFLLRDFGACISIPRLYGQDFLDRNPKLLEDFWKFDNNVFPMLMIGIPTWAPIKTLREGLAARARLHDALEGYYRRVNQYKDGEPVDFGADMSDVSTTALERNNVFKEFSISIRLRAEFESGTFWGLNANTQPMVFWFILYIYSTPGLLDALRQEVESCVTLSTKSHPPQITELDYQRLGRDCPLLRSSLFETFRMADEATSLRRVAKPMTVVDGDHRHELQPGTWVSAPHAGVQYNPSIYPDPKKFIPDRFLEVDEETGRRVPRYGRLKPWGAGAGICKGRTFAEKEILGIAACFITLWDMDAVGGKWEVPAAMPGTGVKRPVKEVRVIIRRRTFA